MSGIVTRFIAIPVGQGDAFYLETPSGSVLVDGGRGSAGFAELFMQTTRAKGVDIVVCTHNDADHANGIIGFLEGGLECREVWLPGRWLGVLPHVLNPNPKVAEALAVQAREAAPALRERSRQAPDIRTLFEIYGDSMLGEPFGYDEESSSPLPISRPVEVTDGWPGDLAEALEQALWDEWEWLREPWGWLLGWMPYWWRKLPPYPREWYIWRVACQDPVACALFLGALDAAERIRRIAVAAYHRGVAVRWLEYTASSPQGGTRWLRPLYGREVAYVPPVPIDKLLCCLALTTSNRKSLVFWADLDDCPGVLFTADSDLRDVHQLPDLTGAIITAPHHGSEANANAYSKVSKHLGSSQANITWVRSDGCFQDRPGQSYLSAPGRRICTICRTRARQPKQAVRLLMRRRWRRWVRERGVRLCSCQ